MDPSGITLQDAEFPLSPSDAALLHTDDEKNEDDDGPETWPGLFA
jgi:hypothetical protein